MASSFLRFLDITHSDTSQSLGLLWTSDQFLAVTSTWQDTTLKTDIHANGGIRTRNPNLHLRLRGHWDRHKTYFLLQNLENVNTTHTMVQSLIISTWFGTNVPFDHFNMIRHYCAIWSFQRDSALLCHLIISTWFGTNVPSDHFNMIQH